LQNSSDPAAAAPAAVGGMLPDERRAIAALSAIYGARMLGLFLLLPVLALYAGGLPGATPVWVGVALGAYGLTQAVLQIPLGVLSDRIGRRPVIALGLVLYGLGSLIGACAGTLTGVIAARLVQGAGAVSGPVTALLADLTRSEVRTRAMAVIGITIGGSFIVSLVGAPILQAAIGVTGIFEVMAALALLCVALLFYGLPMPVADTRVTRVPLAKAFRGALLPYYAGVFVLNFVLTAAFFGIPHALRDQLQVALDQQWRTYLWVFLASVPPTMLLVLYSERAQAPVRVMRFSAVLLSASLLAMVFCFRSYGLLSSALVGFFAAFNYLEARLPARLSQLAGTEVRGTALGVFATAQFLGAFIGGVVAGILSGTAFGIAGVFGGCAVVAGVWGLALFRRDGA